jgi:hypothetical protein
MRARLMVVTDIPAVQELGKLMHDENAPQLPFSMNVVFSHAMQCITTGHHPNVTFVVENGAGDIIGFLNGFVANYSFCEGVLAQQELLFVKKEYRHTRAMLYLLKAFMDWASKYKPLQIFVGVLRNELETAEKIAKVFEKFGFTHTGHYYRWDAEYGS